jgi:hypothetical protein
MIDIVSFIIISAAALVLVFGYIFGRKINLRLSREVSKELERIFAPKDQTYVWIGGLIGFRAAYVVEGLTYLKITMLMLPRHSILYYPISKLTSRNDRLWVDWGLKQDPGFEFHIAEYKSRRLISEIEKNPRLTRGEGIVGKSKVVFLYDENGKKAMDEFLKGTDQLGFIYFKMGGEKKSAGLYCYLNIAEWKDAIEKAALFIRKKAG